MQGKYLPTPLVLGKSAILVNPKEKDDKSKFLGFCESLALQHLRPTSH